MPDAPRVTVIDPSRPDDGSPDVLGDDAPRSRRGLYALLALLVALGAWRGTTAVLDDRAAAAEERRLAGIVELAVEADGTSSASRADDVASASITVAVRNDGPRPVELLSLSYGSFAFEGEREVRPGRTTRLNLTARAACGSRPPDEVLGGTVALTARTSGGAQVERDLPFDGGAFFVDQLARACGYLEVQEAAGLFVDVAFLAFDSSVELRGTVENSGRFPLLLTAVRPGAGLSLQLLATDGTPLPLPLELPPGTDQVTGRDVRLVLRVADCAAVVRPAPADVPEEGRADALFVAFARPGDPTSELDGYLTTFASPPFLALLDQACGR